MTGAPGRTQKTCLSRGPRHSFMCLVGPRCIRYCRAGEQGEAGWREIERQTDRQRGMNP